MSGGSLHTTQIVEGMVGGKRKRGRQKKQWFDNISVDRIELHRAKCSTQDGSEWKRVIKKCARGQQWSGVTAGQQKKQRKGDVKY